jgi:peptide/nickel transport system substrate-binding protein
VNPTPKRSGLRLFSLIMVLCLLIIAGCGGGAPTSKTPEIAPAPSKEELRIGHNTIGTKSLDPVKGTWVPIRTGIGETLFQIDSEGKVQPWLAIGYVQVDAKTWRIKIRPNVHFHNGALVDAAAVARSLNRAMKESTTVPGLLRAERIEAQDGDLVIVTSQPNAALINNLAHPVLAILDTNAAADPNSNVASRPIMTGPYMVKEFQPDQSAVLERNPQYWGGTAGFKRITIRFMGDPNARAMALQSGELDIIMDTPAEAIPTIMKDASLQVDSMLGVRANLVFFNTRKAPFDDARVRRAVSLAIDREALAKTIMMGYAVPEAALFPGSLPYGGVKSAESGDPKETAKRLLDEAGWVQKTGSTIRVKDGVPLSVTLLSYPQRAELNVTAEAIQSYLAAIGVEVKIQVVQDIVAELDKKAYDFTLWSQATAVTADPLSMLDSTFRSGAPTNYAGYSNKELDQLIDRLASTADLKERNQVAIQAQQLLLQDSPAAVLFHQKTVVARSKNLIGVELRPVDYYMITQHTKWQDAK